MALGQALKEIRGVELKQPNSIDEESPAASSARATDAVKQATNGHPSTPPNPTAATLSRSRDLPSDI